MPAWPGAGVRSSACRLGAALALAACLWKPAAATPAVVPLSVDTLFSTATVWQAAISPDGRHVAAIVIAPLGRRVVLIRTSNLQVQPAEPDGRPLMPVRGAFPRRVSWVTNSVFAVDHGAFAEARDLSGKKVADLGTATLGKLVAGNPDSPTVLVFRNHEHSELGIANVATGEMQKVQLPGLGTPVRWAFDETGTLRALTQVSEAFWRDTAKATQWYRPSADSAWQVLGESGILEERWMPVSARAGSNTLVVLSREGRDTYAVFNFDAAKRERGPMLAGYPDADVVYLDQPAVGEFNSVVSSGMKPVRRWFDQRWADLQATVDDALPGRINLLSGDPRGMLLVFSYADVDPGRWYLLDTQTMTQRVLAVARPEIDTARMRPMQVLHYPSSDGLSIPAYLTLPADQPGPRPHPMVVLVHGGPAARDHWGWQPDVQLLASRGYAVFQPQFRGSTGFGKAFELAGVGQWGQAMQDDITAGVQHMIRQGVADPRRICIYGASYGGYAAVWGLIKTPELYRCGISLAGVSDIESMLSGPSDANRSKISREMLRFRVGDGQGTRQRFDEVSPVKHAQRIQAPLLLAHGEQDERVPIAHSIDLMKALDTHQKSYEWLPLPGEGHSLAQLPSLRKFSRSLLAFLDRHIGAAQAPTAPEAAGAASSPH